MSFLKPSFFYIYLLSLLYVTKCVKMDTTNKELLEKANMLVDGDIVNMYFYIPKNANYRDTDKWISVETFVVVILT